MRNDYITAEICVIGGGPAGSTIAHRLAKLGHDVCLLDRQPGAQRPPASLAPTILPLLDYLGVRERVEDAGFLRPSRVVVQWSESEPVVREHEYPLGFHVERNRFDALLLENAASAGVRVLTPAFARPPLRVDDAVWRVGAVHARRTKTIVANFVVDASGGKLRAGARLTRVSEPLLALYALWNGLDNGAGEGRVEAGDDEWFWHAPLQRDRSVAAVLFDPRRAIAEPIEASYKRLLLERPFFRAHLRGSMESAVHACDASSRFVESPVEPGFLKVGDAAFNPDPLSSQGVQLAMGSALQAAIVIHTILLRPANAEAAMAFYRDRQADRVRQFNHKTALFYRERAARCRRPFWTRRCGNAADPAESPLEERRLEPSCGLQVSNTVHFVAAPVIRDDMVVPALAIRHENLNTPLAFLDGIDIIPLLRRIRPGQDTDSILQTWSDVVSLTPGWKILQWLWQRRIVIAAQ